MSKRLQTGGSQGEPVRSSSMPFFFQGVKAVELITKNVYGIRILPAFQRDDSRMPISPTAFIPYRDAANIEAGSAKPAFTDWYYSLKGYKFLGNEGRGFLSPLIMEKTDHRGVDPLFDCYHLARNSKDTRPDWFALTEKAEGEKNATLEKYRVFCAFNCLMQVDNSPVNRLAIVTKVSLDDLKEQLDVLCSRADNPNDPEWPDFMLGDITSPYHGLWGTVQKGVFNKAGMEASLFSFSRSKDRLVNVVKYPVDPTSAWGQEVLAARYDIGDLEKVTRVSTAEEILEFIVNDGFLPIELVREACSPFWDVPEAKGRRTSAPRAYDEGEAADAGGGGSFAPRTPAPTRQAPTPAPAAATAPTPVPSSRQFWIVMPGGQVSPQPMPESVLRNMVVQHKQDFQAMVVGEAAWKTAAAYGITVPAPTPAPAPPAPPAAHSAPPAPPAAPQAPAAPQPPPRPAAAPTPRTIAPGAPAPGGVPTMPAPGGGVPPPPARPAPAQPAAAPPAPPAAPVAPPAPAPAAPPTPPAAAPATPPVVPQAAAPAAAATPLTQAEREELAVLEKEWLNVLPTGVQMDGARVARFCELSDRASAAVQG